MMFYVVQGYILAGKIPLLPGENYQTATTHLFVLLSCHKEKGSKEQGSRSDISDFRAEPFLQKTPVYTQRENYQTATS